jgi:hypothetical protein
VDGVEMIIVEVESESAHFRSSRVAHRVNGFSAHRVDADAGFRGRLRTTTGRERDKLMS